MENTTIETTANTMTGNNMELLGSDGTQGFSAADAVVKPPAPSPYQGLTRKIFEGFCRDSNFDVNAERPKGVPEDDERFAKICEKGQRLANTVVFGVGKQLVETAYGYANLADEAGVKPSEWEAFLPSDRRLAAAWARRVIFPNLTQEQLEKHYGFKNDDDIAEAVLRQMTMHARTPEQIERVMAGMDEEDAIEYALELQKGRKDVYTPVTRGDAISFCKYISRKEIGFENFILSRVADANEFREAIALSLYNGDEKDLPSVMLNTFKPDKNLDSALRVVNAARAIRIYDDGSWLSALAEGFLSGGKNAVLSIADGLTTKTGAADKDWWAFVNKKILSSGGKLTTSEAVFRDYGDKFAEWSKEFEEEELRAHLNSIDDGSVDDSVLDSYAARITANRKPRDYVALYRRGDSLSRADMALGHSRSFMDAQYPEEDWWRPFMQGTGGAIGNLLPIAATAALTRFVPIPAFSATATGATAFAMGRGEMMNIYATSGDVTTSPAEKDMAANLYGGVLAATSTVGLEGALKGSVAAYRGVLGKAGVVSSRATADFSKRGLGNWLSDAVSLDTKLFVAKHGGGLLQNSAQLAARLVVAEGINMGIEGVEEGVEEALRFGIMELVNREAKNAEGEYIVNREAVVEGILSALRDGAIYSVGMRATYGAPDFYRSGKAVFGRTLGEGGKYDGERLIAASRRAVMRTVGAENAARARIGNEFGRDGATEAENAAEFKKVSEVARSLFAAGSDEAAAEFRGSERYASLTDAQKGKVEELVYLYSNTDERGKLLIESALLGQGISKVGGKGYTEAELSGAREAVALEIQRANLTGRIKADEATLSEIEEERRRREYEAAQSETAGNEAEERAGRKLGLLSDEKLAEEAEIGRRLLDEERAELATVEAKLKERYSELGATGKSRTDIASGLGRTLVGDTEEAKNARNELRERYKALKDAGADASFYGLVAGVAGFDIESAEERTEATEARDKKIEEARAAAEEAARELKEAEERERAAAEARAEAAREFNERRRQEQATQEEEERFRDEMKKLEEEMRTLRTASETARSRLDEAERKVESLVSQAEKVRELERDLNERKKAAEELLSFADKHGIDDVALAKLAVIKGLAATEAEAAEMIKIARLSRVLSSDVLAALSRAPQSIISAVIDIASGVEYLGTGEELSSAIVWLGERNWNVSRDTAAVQKGNVWFKMYVVALASGDAELLRRFNSTNVALKRAIDARPAGYISTPYSEVSASMVGYAAAVASLPGVSEQTKRDIRTVFDNTAAYPSEKLLRRLFDEEKNRSELEGAGIFSGLVSDEGAMDSPEVQERVNDVSGRDGGIGANAEETARTIVDDAKKGGAVSGAVLGDTIVNPRSGAKGDSKAFSITPNAKATLGGGKTFSAKSITARAPYLITGNKAAVIAENSTLFRRIGEYAKLRGGRIMDLFGGACVYFYGLDSLGVLSKGEHQWNEFSTVRFVTNTQIKENPEEVIKHLDDILNRLYASEEMAEYKKRIDMFNNHATPYYKETTKGDTEFGNKPQSVLISWLHDELNGRHAGVPSYVSKPGTDAYGAFLKNEARTAALYLVVQGFATQSRAIGSGYDEAAGGAVFTSPVTNGKGDKAIESGQVTGFFSSDGGKGGNKKVFLAENTRFKKDKNGERAIYGLIREASKMFREKGIRITQGNGWEWAMKAKRGDVVFIDPAYIGTMGYQAGSAKDSGEEEFLADAKRLIEYGNENGVTYIFTNEYDNRGVRGRIDFDKVYGELAEMKNSDGTPMVRVNKTYRGKGKPEIMIINDGGAFLLNPSKFEVEEMQARNPGVSAGRAVELSQAEKLENSGLDGAGKEWAADWQRSQLQDVLMQRALSVFSPLSAGRLNVQLRKFGGWLGGVNVRVVDDVEAAVNGQAQRGFVGSRYDGDAELEVVKIDVPLGVDEQRDTAKIRNEILKPLIGQEVEILSDGRVVHIENSSKDALKKRGIHRAILPALKELISKSNYFDYRNTDGKEKHGGILGQFVYVVPVLLGDKVYRCELLIDRKVSSETGSGSFKQQSVFTVSDAKIAGVAMSDGIQSVHGVEASRGATTTPAMSVKFADLMEGRKPNVPEVRFSIDLPPPMPEESAEVRIVGSEYETKLTPAELKEFNAWKAKLPQQLQYEGDYDLKGLWKRNPNEEPSENLHFPDDFKKPNHMTFSTGSIYSNEQTKGGEWIKDKDGVWTFYASPFNLTQHSVDELTWYFKEFEKDARLVLPETGLFTINNFLFHRDGKVYGAYNPNTKEVFIAKNARADTLLHELGWHATYDWAEKNAPELRAQMESFARSAPEELKRAVAEAYGYDYDEVSGESVLGDTGAEERRQAFLDEAGAAFFSQEHLAKIEAAIDAEVDGTLRGKMRRAWNAFKELMFKVWARITGGYNRYYTEDGKRKVDLKGILSEAGTPSEVMAKIADAFARGQMLADLANARDKESAKAEALVWADLNSGTPMARALEADFRYSFVGERGAAAMDAATNPLEWEMLGIRSRIQNLNVARKLEAEGKDRAEIIYATGWYRGKDKKWRYEIPDGKIKDGIEPHVKEDGMKWLALGEIYDAPELYKAYPELKEMRVEFDADVDTPLYDEDDKVICLPISWLRDGKFVLKRAKKSTGLRQILVHEIQHVIQEKEGFARGGNLESSRAWVVEIATALGVSLQSKIPSVEAIKELLSYVGKASADKLKAAVEIAERHGFTGDFSGLVDYITSLAPIMFYFHLAGEVEARNVEYRLDEDEGRLFPWSTADVAEEEQIVLQSMLDTAESRIAEESSEVARIEAEARANGTWLKAPNGKPSKLNERQWVQVRTEAFKKWFGDWEKAARIEKLKAAPTLTLTDYHGQYELNRDSARDWALKNLRTKYVINDTNEEIEIKSVGAKKVTSHSTDSEVHLKSIASIPILLKNAIFISEAQSEKDNAKFDSYRYYVVGIKIDGIDYTARITVGVKNGKRFYDHSLTQIEKGILVNLASNKQGDKNASNGFKAKGNATVALSSADIKDNRLLQILQVDSSKIVDENGEPLVIYSGTRDANHTSFTDKMNKPGDKGVMWGSNQRGVARSYAGTDAEASWETVDDGAESTLESEEADEYDQAAGYSGEIQPGVYSVFLNIRNPKHVDANGRRWNEIQTGGKQKKSVEFSMLPDDVAERVAREKASYTGVEVELDENGDWVNFEECADAIEEFYREWNAETDDDGNIIEYGETPRFYENGDIAEVVPATETTRDIANRELGNGNDGIVFYNIEDKGRFGVNLGQGVFNIGTNVYVVPSSEQIKSATDNVGTFDSGNADIRYQREDTEDVSPADKQFEAEARIVEAQRIIEEAAPKVIARTNAEATEALKKIQGKPIVNRETGIEARVSNTGRGKLISNKAADKSVANGFTREQHNTAAANIGDLFERAHIYEERSDVEGDANIKSIKRFASLIVFDGVPAEADILLKETEQGGNRIYTVELQEIKMPSERSQRREIGGQDEPVNIHTFGGRDRVAEEAEKVNSLSRYYEYGVFPSDVLDFHDAERVFDSVFLDEMIDSLKGLTEKDLSEMNEESLWGVVRRTGLVNANAHKRIGRLSGRNNDIYSAKGTILPKLIGEFIRREANVSVDEDEGVVYFENNNEQISFHGVSPDDIKRVQKYNPVKGVWNRKPQSFLSRSDAEKISQAGNYRVWELQEKIADIRSKREFYAKKRFIKSIPNRGWFIKNDNNRWVRFPEYVGEGWEEEVKSKGNLTKFVEAYFTPTNEEIRLKEEFESIRNNVESVKKDIRYQRSLPNTRAVVNETANAAERVVSGLFSEGRRVHLNWRNKVLTDAGVAADVISEANDAYEAYSFEVLQSRIAMAFNSEAIKAAAKLKTRAELERKAGVQRKRAVREVVERYGIPPLGSEAGGVIGWGRKVVETLRAHTASEVLVLEASKTVLTAYYHRLSVRVLSAANAVKLEEKLGDISEAVRIDAVLKIADEIEALLLSKAEKRSVEQMRTATRDMLKKYSRFVLNKDTAERKIYGGAERFLKVLHDVGVLRAKLDWNEGVFDEMRVKLEGVLADTELSEEARLDALYKLRALAFWYAKPLREMNVEELMALQDLIADTVAAGATLREGVLEAREAAIEEAWGVIALAIRQSAERSGRAAGAESEARRAYAWLMSGQSMRSKLESAIRYADEETYNAAKEALRVLDARITEANNRAAAKVADDEYQFFAAVLRYAGKEELISPDRHGAAYVKMSRAAESVLVGLFKKAEGSEKFSIGGKKRSLMELMAQYLMMRQKEWADIYENEPEEKHENDAAYKRWLMNDELAEFLGEELIALADAVSDILQARAKEIDAQAVKDTGVALSYGRGDGYFPIVHNLGDYMRNLRVKVRGGVPSSVPSILTPRQHSRKDIDESADLLSVFRRHVFDVAQYTSFGETDTGVVLRGFLDGKKYGEEHKGIGRVLGATLSNDLWTHIAQTITGRMQGGEYYESADGMDSVFGVFRWVSRMLGLGFNFISGAKQVAGGLPSYVNAYGFGNTLSAVLKNPLAVFDAYKELVESDGYAQRYGNASVERSLLTAKYSKSGIPPAAAKAFLRAENASMVFTSYGDRIPLFLVGGAIYTAMKNEYIARGETEEEAKRLAQRDFWIVQDRTQQARQIQNVDAISRTGSSLHKSFVQFLTSPFQFLSDEIHAIEDAFARGDKESIMKLATIMVHNHVLQAGAMYLVNLLARYVFSDDDDELELLTTRDAAIFALGSLSAFPVIGSALENAFIGVFGEDTYGSTSMYAPAATETVSRVSSRAVKLVKSLFDDKEGSTAKAVKKLAESSAAIRYFNKAWDKYIDDEE